MLYFPSHRKNGSVSAGALIAFGILIVLGGYALFQTRRYPSDFVPPEPKGKGISAPVPPDLWPYARPAVSEDYTVGWKTYRNEQYGFEMRYPSDWYYSGSERGNSQYLLCFNPKGLSGDCSMLLTVNWNTTLEAWMKNFVKKSSDVIEEHAIEINGVVGRKLVIEKIEHIFVEKNGFVYHFTKTLPSQVFDGFLSSFKFIK